MSIYPGSLSRTIDSASDALQRGVDVPSEERGALVRWLGERQVLSGRNAGAFAPTSSDLARGVHLYTGERLRTKLAAWNVLTAEAARLLVLLGESFDSASAAVDRAATWLAVSCFGARDCVVGECAHSFVAHLRFLNAADQDPALVVRGVNALRAERDGAGRWRRFPFYYTLLTLTEVPAEPARRELRYAVEACERVRGRGAKDEVFSARRQRLVERVIALDDLHLL